MGAPYGVDMWGFVAFPVVKNKSEIKDFGTDVTAAVGVDGGDSTHVRAILAETAEVCGVEEANGETKLVE